MDAAYQRENVGFLAKLGTGSDLPVEPAPEPQPAKGACVVDIDPSLLRLAMFPQGFAVGVARAQGALSSGRSIRTDLAELLEQVRDARKGPALNHAMGECGGFLWEIDQVFTAMRASGVTVTFPPLDPRFVDDLERIGRRGAP